MRSLIFFMLPILGVSIAQAQFVPVDPLPEEATRIFGGRTDGMLGATVKAAGDINGDGRGDFVLTAPQADIVYVIFGRGNLPTSINLNLLGPNGFPILGEVGTQFGASVAALGDVNRDGRDDLAIGAPFAGEGGKIYGFRGGFSFSTIDITNPENLLYTVEGIDDESLGSNLNDGGDINNDGFSDLLIPSPERLITVNGETSIGAAYIIYGNFSFTPKTFRTDELNAEHTLTLAAEPTRTSNDFSIAFDLLQDFTGDDFPDVGLVGGIELDGDIIKNDFFIFSGRTKPTGIQVIGKTEFPMLFFSFQFFESIRQNAITGIASMDLNEDGLNDLLLGYPFSGGQPMEHPPGSIVVVPGTELQESGVLIDRTRPVTTITTHHRDALFGQSFAVLDEHLSVGLQNALSPFNEETNPGIVFLLNMRDITEGAPNVAEGIAARIFIGKVDQGRFGASVDLSRTQSGQFLLAGSPGDMGVDTNDDGFPDVLGTGMYLLPVESEPVTNVPHFMLYEP